MVRAAGAAAVAAGAFRCDQMLRTGQLASYAWGAANVIFVVGAQKLVPDVEAAHQRIYTHSLPLEDARAQAVYGQHSQVGRSWRSTPNCPAGSTSSSSASPLASEPSSQPNRPGSGPTTVNAVPGERSLALAPLDEKVDHVRRAPPPGCLEGQPEGDTTARSG